MSQSSSLILNCILFISCQFSVFIRPYNNTEKKKTTLALAIYKNSNVQFAENAKSFILQY